MKVCSEFYCNSDVLKISQKLLGKTLCTNINGQLTSGTIVETEAYRGPEDKASHAYNNRRTKRTETMFQAGGIAYVYLCYGIHHLFNIVIYKQDVPHAVLVRAIEPTEGIELMLQRRNKNQLQNNLTAGPGAMSQALGINTQHDATSLQSDIIWIEEGITVPEKNILARPRVGVAYAKEHATRPWRFSIQDNPWVSRAK